MKSLHRSPAPGSARGGAPIQQKSLSPITSLSPSTAIVRGWGCEELYVWLAKIEPAPLEKVETIEEFCPTGDTT